MASLDVIRAYTPYVLSEMAGCAAPDSLTSPGAVFLASVLSDFTEALEGNRFDTEDANDVARESADSTPDLYTRARWLEYVDLAAYSEEEETGGGWPSDPFEMAGAALSQVAYRLFMALVADLDDADDDVEADDDDSGIPSDFPVRPLVTPAERAAARDLATDGRCGRSWDDAISTAYTPAPSGRCPFESFHGDDDAEVTA